MFKKNKEKKEKRKKEKKNNHHPLYLPKGSIRAIIVLLLTIFLGICIFLSREIPRDIATVWLSLVSYYAGSRLNS